MNKDFSQFPLEAAAAYAVRCAERVYPIYGIFLDIPEHTRHLRDLEVAIKTARAFALDDAQWTDWGDIFGRASHRDDWVRRLKLAENYAQAAEFVDPGAAVAVAKSVNEAVAAARGALRAHQAVKDINYGGPEGSVAVAEAESCIHARSAGICALEAASSHSNAETDIVRRAVDIDYEWVLENRRSP